MVKCKNCIQDRNNYIILLTQYRLFVNICTDNREEPGVHAAPADLQRETKAVMSCQAFAIVASNSTCTCSYSTVCLAWFLC